jgi:hypothetical protein
MSLRRFDFAIRWRDLSEEVMAGIPAGTTPGPGLSARGAPAAGAANRLPPSARAGGERSTATHPAPSAGGEPARSSALSRAI